MFIKTFTIIYGKHCSWSDLGRQYYTEHAMKAVWSDLGTYCLLRLVSTIVFGSQCSWSDLGWLCYHGLKRKHSDGLGLCCLFEPVCPIIYGNYGMYVDDTVSLDTLYLYNGQKQTNKQKKNIVPERRETFLEAKIATKNVRKLQSSETSSPVL